MSAAGARVPPARPRLHRLVVTRPRNEAQLWVQRLQAAGWPAQPLPLIELAEPQRAVDRQALAHWRGAWAQRDALMFVSRAAVEHFWAEGVAAPGAGAFNTRLWAPGPGTKSALAAVVGRWGLGEQHIDAPPADAPQFDSEALWPVVASQMRAGARVLIVRGRSVPDEPPQADTARDHRMDETLPGEGREWLIRQCQASGAEVASCVAYERRQPVWTPPMHSQADAATAPGSVWLFSSSQALDHLLAAQASRPWGEAAALATHPRIAERARAAGFGAVHETRPTLPDVVRALELGWSLP